MRSARSSSKIASSRVAACAAAAMTAFIAPASAQTTNSQSVAPSKYATSTNRAVGVEGRLKEVYWSTAPSSEEYLAEMSMAREASRLLKAPGAMRRTKVWMARADVCNLPGDEILMQIRGPLTCGSLGCEMVVLSDADGAPRVLLRTVGDTIDAPVIDGLVINRGAKNQRAWRYENDKTFRELKLR